MKVILTDRIYAYFLRLTRRLSTRQMLMVLAVVVGLLAGLGTFLFEVLLHAIGEGLTRWFSVEKAQFLYLIYPAIGIILATLFVRYIVRDLTRMSGLMPVLFRTSAARAGPMP